MKFFPEEILGIIDIDSVQARKDSFIEEELNDAYANLLFSAQLNNEESYFYFLFEHKSSKKKSIAFDLLHYMQQIWKTLIKKEKMMEVPHIIPILFYHGESEWSDVRTIGDWTKGYHQFPEKIQQYSPNFDFIMVDMSPKAGMEIAGDPKLRAYLELSRHIFIEDKEMFYEVIRLIEKLLINDNRKYLLTVFTYVFSARKDVRPKEIKKQLLTKGGVKMMSLKDFLIQEEREEERISILRKTAKNFLTEDWMKKKFKK